VLPKLTSVQKTSPTAQKATASAVLEQAICMLGTSKRVHGMPIAIKLVPHNLMLEWHRTDIAMVYMLCCRTSVLVVRFVAMLR
jgi:hypothetical protein